MNIDEAIKELQNCRITSLGTLAHGYVIYEQTALSIVERVAKHYYNEGSNDAHNAFKEASNRVSERLFEKVKK